MRRLAILDDYRHFALSAADWSAVEKQCSVTVFERHLNEEQAVTELSDFEVLCTLRERMSFPRSLIARLPNLRLIAATGARHHRSMDVDAATDCGVVCCYTSAQGNGVNAPAEHTWALILALARHIPQEANRMRHRGWQSTVGVALYGRTLGLMGLGSVAQKMCPVAKAFGMEVIGWSQNLTAEKAAAHGVRLVTKEALFRESDFLSVQLALSDRTVNIVSAAELALMKPTAFLINTSRGPIVKTGDLVSALEAKKIAGAALDVFDHEPLPDDDRLRRVENLLLTPHLGYNVEELLRAFYGETVENVAAFLAGAPIRVLNPEVLGRPR